jgi:hypothetical protein
VASCCIARPTRICTAVVSLISWELVSSSNGDANQTRRPERPLIPTNRRLGPLLRTEALPELAAASPPRKGRALRRKRSGRFLSEFVRVEAHLSENVRPKQPILTYLIRFEPKGMLCLSVVLLGVYAVFLGLFAKLVQTPTTYFGTQKSQVQILSPRLHEARRK